MSIASHAIYVADPLTIDDHALSDQCNFSVYPTQTFTYSGGYSPYTIVHTGSTLPTGMSFNDTTLELSGTPNIVRTDAGVELEPFNLRITVISDDAQSAQKDFPFNIKLAPVLHDTSAVNGFDLPDGQLSVAYSTNQIYVDTAVGAELIDTWAVTAGALPAGLTLAPNTLADALLDGTPTEVGYFPFTVTATAQNGCQGTKSYALNINGSALVVITTNLPGVCRGSTYNETLALSGGTGPYTWAITTGVLPTGLTLHSDTGVIDGTVDASVTAETYSFTVEVTDSIAETATRPISIVVWGEPVWVTTSPLLSGAVGTSYSSYFVATGATQYEFNTGNLPPGLSIAPDTGLFTGTPTTVGEYTFDVNAISVNGCLKTKTFIMTIEEHFPDLTGTFSNICNKTKYYNNSIVATFGTPPFTFAITGGFLPEGLIFNNISGTIGGVATTPGTYSFDVAITDGIGLTGTKTFGFTVYNSPIIEVPAAPPAIYGKVYAYTFTATGGTKPFTWTIDTLPPGLVFSAYGGSINGTPTVAGVFEPTVTVTDAHGCFDTRKIVLNIFGPPIINELPLPPACQNQDYNNYILVSGGNSPYYWFITSETFPPQNLILNPYTGQLSGIPLIPGAYFFTVKVVDQNTLYATKNYTLIVRTEQECGQPDEGQSVTITKVRLSSMESQPVIVEDPFHQRFLYQYLPAPFSIEK